MSNPRCRIRVVIRANRNPNPVAAWLQSMAWIRNPYLLKLCHSAPNPNPNPNPNPKSNSNSNPNHTHDPNPNPSPSPNPSLVAIDSLDQLSLAPYKGSVLVLSLSFPQEEVT